MTQVSLSWKWDCGGAPAGRPQASPRPIRRSPATDELALLYTQLGPQVEKRVRAGVKAPHAIIEDACQFAWTHLIPRRRQVREDRVLSWLITTATHQALELLRRDRRELSWEETLASGSNPFPAAAPDPEELVIEHERLNTMGALPPRQRRLLWLHGLGFSYSEIARHEACTQRTVERQLLRAKRRLGAADARGRGRACAACAQLG